MVLTGTGKVLAEHDRYPSEVMREGMRAWHQLPDAERRPRKVSGVPKIATFPSPPEPPAGGIILRAHIRGLERLPEGALTWTGPITVASGEYSYAAEPQLDHVWITEAEWQAMIPDNPRVSDLLQVPASVSQRLATFHLMDKALGCGVFFWEKATADLRLRVAAVDTATIRMELEGSARIGKTGDYPVKLLGRLTVDRRRREFTRFDLIALGKDDGDMRSPEQRLQRFNLWYRIDPQSKVVMAIAFELIDPAQPLNRVPPYALMYDSERTYGRPYFNTPSRP
jgi:hypothetical protein